MIKHLPYFHFFTNLNFYSVSLYDYYNDIYYIQNYNFFLLKNTINQEVQHHSVVVNFTS